jgi:hypothetical protein
MEGPEEQQQSTSRKSCYNVTPFELETSIVTASLARYISKVIAILHYVTQEQTALPFTHG